MTQARGFSDKIIRIYLIGATVLLAFYMYAFHAGIMLTENTVVERRISIVAPHHFQQFSADVQGPISIDPLLTIYDDYRTLPAHVQSKLSPQWSGTKHLILDDDREFQVFATLIKVNGIEKMVYAVEDSNAVEWDDTQFVLTEVMLVGVGVLLFLVCTAYMVKAAKQIASPFLQVANQLSQGGNSSLSGAENKSRDFSPIVPEGEQTRELIQILAALNEYRRRLAQQMAREQSFTRYVSHELRTPMTIIKGALSHLKRDANGASSMPIDKITKATAQMETLTHTFLTLARDRALETETLVVDDTLVEREAQELVDVINANQVDFQWQLKAPFSLDCHPQLFKAVVQNLLKNAFSCSVNGKVTLLLDEQRIDVIDNGVGLGAQPRGYEGFGIGLVLVEDICHRYGWSFSLSDNQEQGCTASVQLSGANR